MRNIGFLFGFNLYSLLFVLTIISLKYIVLGILTFDPPCYSSFLMLPSDFASVDKIVDIIHWSR